MATITRTYSFLICNEFGQPYAPINVEKTYNWYNRGASYFLDFWLDFMGGITTAKDVDGVSNEVNCFSCWFTPHRETENTNVNVVPTENLKEKFEEYYGKEATDPMLVHLFNTVTFKEENSDDKERNRVWIDRKKRFQSLKNRIGITEKDVDSIVSMKDFVWSSDKESDVFVRSCLSAWWGQGEKTDWYEAILVLTKVKNRINDNPVLDFFKDYLNEVFGDNPVFQENSTCKVVFDAVMGGKLINLNSIEEMACQEGFDVKISWQEMQRNYLKQILDIKDDIYKKFKESLSGGKAKVGADDSLCKLIKKAFCTNEEIDLSYLMKFVDASISTASEKSSREVKPWMSVLREEMESVIEMKYNSQEKCLLEEVQQMWLMAIHRYRTWKGGFYLHLKNRIEQSNNIGEFNSNLSKVIESCRKENQRYFNLRQFRGIRDLIKRWEDNPDYAVNILFEYSKENDFGDMSILMKIAKYVEENGTENLEDDIYDFISSEKAKRRYYQQKNPPLTYLDTNPENPWFSKDRGFVPLRKIPFINKKKKYHVVDGKRQFKVVEGHIQEISMRLFDGEKLSQEKVYLMSWNYNKDICEIDGVIQRNAFLENSASKNNFSFNILSKNGKWYAHSSVVIEVPKINAKESLSYCKADGKMMGVDLGMRNPVTYAILNVDSDGEVRISNNKKEYVDLIVDSKGFIEESIKINRGEFNRLTANKDERLVSDYRLWELVANENKKKPVTVNALVNDLAYIFPNVVEKLSEDKIYEISDYIFNTRGGGLSFQRMSNLGKLISAFYRYSSIFTKENIPCRVSDTISAIYKKLNAIRSERVKIIANLIMKKAWQENVKVIFMEDLSLTSSQGNNSRNNQKLTNWCCRSILFKVEQSCKEYGILLKKIDPRDTSLIDYHTGVLKPKFSKHKFETLDSDWLKDRIKKNLRKSASKRKTLIREMLLAKSEKHSCGVVDSLKKEADGGEIYVPNINGEHYYSDFEGWIDSDINAAINICARGVKTLFGWGGYIDQKIKISEFDWKA